MSTGISARHARSCPSYGRGAGPCRCTPTWQAKRWDNRAQRNVVKTFKTRSAAKLWREEDAVALRRGEIAGDRGRRLAEAAMGWLDDIERGHISNRSGDRYKPSTVRSYHQA